MIAEIGHYLLALAVATALFQFLVPQLGTLRGEPTLMASARPAAIVQFLLVAGAFAALVALYVSSDFSVANVWANSHTAKPLFYKVSGVWGNHEGSMLLWVLILTMFGAAVALFGGNLPHALKAQVLAIQGLIGLLFLAFIVTVSNPFARLVDVPIEGNGLNPVLQDPALAIHPPFLYAGYVGLSVAFSFACAALVQGSVDPAWARWVRPWTLAAWMFLTAGIALGSWWAYYELGWGGFWFWDPVENASFMPWLAATALLHSAIVVEKRNALKTWTVLLAIVAFSLSLLGTFLVRSGVLTSVHAFAVDPARGLFILLILCLLIGGAFCLFAWRARELEAAGVFAPLSREGALVVNNLFLACCAATVLIGTLYPLALEAISGTKISVGAPYFNFTFVPLFAPLLLILPLGPMLSWKRADLLPAMERLWAAAAVAIVVAVAVAAAFRRGPWLAPFAMALALWVVCGSIAELAERVAVGRLPLAASWMRFKGLPRAALGMSVAHFGLGVAVLGIVALTAFRQEVVTVLKPGETAAIAGTEVRYLGETPTTGPNFVADTGRYRVSVGGAETAVLASERRVFQPGNQPTTEVGIHPFITGDLYLVMGDPTPGGGRVVRLFFNPLVSLIWLGAALMFAGGLVSLSDRRYRVGVPKPARQAVAEPIR